jgi:hypothetical protein
MPFLAARPGQKRRISGDEISFASTLCKRGEDCLPRRSAAKAGGEGICNSGLLTTRRTLTLPSPFSRERRKHGCALSVTDQIAPAVSADIAASSFFGTSVSLGAIG